MLRLLSRRAIADVVNNIAAESWRHSNGSPAFVCACAKLHSKPGNRIPKHHTSTRSSIPKAYRTVPSEISETELAASDPDVFGTIGKVAAVEYYDEKDDDKGDAADAAFHRDIPFRSDQLPVKKYEEMIVRLIKDKYLKEAIDILEVRMPRDRVKPEYHTFELLIIECGRVGYARKAFQLFNKMKQRDLAVKGPVYAALFNACSKHDDPRAALKLAQGLRKQLIQKGVDINRIIYNSMIKAFGRCDDLETAFALVDEMKDKKMELHIDTLNNLFQACIADKQYGFRNGLLVWHSIYRNRLKPSTESFNLLLRCTRDCGIGDLPIARQAIAKILTDSKSHQKIKQSGKRLLIGDGNNSPATEQVSDGAVASSDDVRDQTPNLISDMPHLGSLMQVNEITTATERMFLLGGMETIISEMDRLKVRPNMKTFTQLLDTIPATFEAECELIEKMRYMRVRADTDFFTILMRRRVQRGDYKDAKSVLTLMKKVNVDPDIATYGVLAMTCENFEETQDFLNKLNEKNVRPNIIIMGALLRNAVHHTDFERVALILKYCMKEEIKPNEKFSVKAADFKNRSYSMLMDNKLTEIQAKHYNRFYHMYKEWRQHFALNEADLRDEPIWKQYKDSRQTGIEPTKNPYIRRLWKRTHVVAKLNPTYLKRIHGKNTAKSDGEQKDPQKKLDG